ncbi:sensor domain-containing protein [Candidatus Clostridium radicumherbarum]|uniref:EAL domain-containing protein n=1 Tax=Candidatus Clostridium radicumherbarum TaxID=3381662 RepID=A0ABW8TTY4_9CLOT
MEDFTLFDQVINCKNSSSCNTRNFCVNLVNNAKTIICVWRINGTLVKFNNYAEEITGYKEKEVLGNKWRKTITDIWLETKTLKVFHKLLSNEPLYDSDLESKFFCKKGSYIDILWSNYLMYDTNGDPEFIVGLGMNITSQKRDELTGLENRSSLSNKASAEILNLKQNGKKLALLYIDLDNFKNINDTLGHSVGNRFLKAIAARLKFIMKDSKNLARIGEDEFAIIYTYNGDIEEVKTFTEKIMSVINHSILIAGKELYITASIGIAIYNEHGDNFDDFVENADTATYYAKELGKNRYCFFTKDLSERTKERIEVETGLRNAIENNTFEIYYQPKIDLKTNEVDGMEALIRWIHPEKGMISPDKFIHIAEASGLIIPIGNKVLYEACRQNKEWQSKGYPPLRVAINLSAKQFEQEDLLETIKAVLEETKLDPMYLEIEITESIIMKDFDFSIDVLNKIREMNIHVSLDDFGTGYSSLNYLKKLPIDALKIDKSFVNNINIDTKDEIITKAVIELAHNMGLEVVAEGVESINQLNFLKQHECDKAQGFLYGKPLSCKDFEKKLSKLCKVYVTERRF